MLKTSIVLIVLLGELLHSYPAWVWFAEGYEVVAIIADAERQVARGRF